MKHPVTPEHIVWKRRLLRENIRASWLRAKHERITAKIDAIKAERVKAA